LINSLSITWLKLLTVLPLNQCCCGRTNKTTYCMNPLSTRLNPALPASETNGLQCFYLFSGFHFKNLATYFFNRSLLRYGYSVVMCMLLGLMSQAQISSSATGGNWNTPATWIGGVVPGSGTAVTIATGATVTVNVSNATCASIIIGSGTRATAILNFNSGGILTVSGNVVIGAIRQRRGSINMSNGGSFKIGGVLSISNLNAFTRGSGTIEYNGSAAQTVGALGTYNNLVLSGSGAKSILAGTAIAGKLFIAGATANIAAGANISVGSLALDGLNRANGTWGSTVSAATNKNNTYFAPSTGLITVTTDGRPVAAFTGLTTAPAITYGTATIALSGTISGAGPTYPVDGETVRVTINGVSQNAVIAGGAGAFAINFNTATLNVNGGPYTVAYAYTGGFNLAPALNNTSTTLTVNAAQVSVTANNVKKIYGTTITGGAGSLAFTATGLQNGETIGSVRIAYGTGAASTSIVGTYTGSVTPSNVTGGNFTASNYRITYVRGQIIVTPAPLIITANNQTKAYGTAIVFTTTAFTSSGLLNGNTVNGVTLTSTGASATAPVAGSPFAIVPSAATGSGLSNYTIAYKNGTLTITGLSQSIADYRSKTSGNFSSAASWEYDQGGSSWANATQLPAINNNISIGHDITLNQNYTTGAGKTLLIATGGTLTVNPGITVDVAATGTLNFNGKPVTIKSTAAGTGAIGKILGTLTGATNVTVERFIATNKRAWRLLTIPVTGTSIRQAWAGVAANGAAPTGESGGTGTLITGHGYPLGTAAAAAGFDWFSGLGNATTSSIRFFSAAAAWASATNTPNPLAVPNKEGYLLYVRGDRTIAGSAGAGTTTLRPAGTLKQGTQTISVNDLYTVVGNPYPASINLDAVYSNTGNSVVINRNFWVWDATLGTSGAYRGLSWNGIDQYDMTGGSGLAADYLVVNSGQAFFVERKASGNINILETNKTNAAPATMLRPAGISGSGVSSLSIRLYKANGNIIGEQADRVVARYNDLYAEATTEPYDVAKLNNFNENLSLVRNSNYLSIESRPFPVQNDTLYLPFWGLAKRDYALIITSNQFTGINQTARLTDAFTNTEIVLELNDSTVTYPFTITSDPSSSSLTRFKIIMTPITVLPVSFTKINASPVGNEVQVSWATGSEMGVKNYAVERSADGSRFVKLDEVTAMDKASGTFYQWIDHQPLLLNSFYRIRSNDADGKYAYSRVVTVQLDRKRGMQVMPTVISNQQLNLMLTNQPAGNYQLSMTNAAGQQIFQKTINHSGAINDYLIDLGTNRLATGVYNLLVKGLNGDHQNFKLLLN
jgi:hypothetical protein